MPGSAIGLSLGFGFAGTISRTPDCIIENKPVKSTSAHVTFGAPVYLDSTNTWVMASASITAANFAGVAVAEVKQGLSYSASGEISQNGYYAPEQPADVVTRGIVAVKCVHGTPAAGGTVYVRKATNGSYPDEVVGDFRADADGGNTITLTNAVWNTGLKDANGILELKIKSINT